MLNFCWESLHAFYFYWYVKQFCMPAMGWVCPYKSFILSHTHFFIKYRDTENVQFWGSRQNRSNCHTMTTILRNWSQSLKLEEVSIYSQVNNTGGGAGCFFYKTQFCVLVSIQILLWPNIRIHFFQRIPALAVTLTL